MESILRTSEELRSELSAIIDEDTEAFNGVMAAFGMVKETEEQKSLRNKAIQSATRSATLVPLKLLDSCQKGVQLARVVAEKGNKNSLSDAGVALLLLQAAANGAALNVRINLAGLEDTQFRDEAYEKVVAVTKNIDELVAHVMPGLIQRL